MLIGTPPVVQIEEILKQQSQDKKSDKSEQSRAADYLTAGSPVQ
jgi:hypothetical protein